MNNLKVRKAELQDIDNTYSVIEQCRDLLAEQGMVNWERYTKEKVERLVMSNDMFILTKGVETVGTVKISNTTPSFFSEEDMEKWENPGAKAFYFTVLAVSPKYQGCGYGTILLNYTENYAKSQGISYLRMTMFSDNLPLTNYYLRRGFTFRQKRQVAELGLTLSFGEKRLNINV